MSKKTKEKETGDEIENADPQMAFDQAMVDWYKLDIGVETNKTLTYGKNTVHYADLPQLISATKKSLAEYGLRIRFKEYYDDAGTQFFRTDIYHIRGGFESTVDILPAWNNIQDHAKHLTYLRRYHMGVLLCLNTDEDLDGNDPDSEPGKSKPLKEKVKPKKKKPVHPDLTALNLKIQETHNFKISAEETLKILGINSLNDVSSMPGDDWSKLTKKLDDELSKRKSNLHKGGN